MGDDVLAELRASGSVLAPDEVAACLVQLVEDDSRAGAVLQITSTEGATFVE